MDGNLDTTDGPARPVRTKRPQSRKDELLDAAQRLIQRLGSSGFRVGDVTEAAGAAKGTFYRYFQTKEQLLATLRARFVSDLLAHTDERVRAAATEGWAAQVRAYVEAGVDYYADNFVLHEVLYHGMWDGGPADDEAGSDLPVVSHLADFISDGVVAGAFRVRDAWLTASLLYSGLHGVLDRENHARRSLDRRRISQSATELYLRALIPQWEPAPKSAGEAQR